MASGGSHIDVIHLLLERGADAEIRRSGGMIPVVLTIDGIGTCGKGAKVCEAVEMAGHALLAKLHILWA